MAEWKPRVNVGDMICVHPLPVELRRPVPYMPPVAWIGSVFNIVRADLLLRFSLPAQTPSLPSEFPANILFFVNTLHWKLVDHALRDVAHQLPGRLSKMRQMLFPSAMPAQPGARVPVSFRKLLDLNREQQRATHLIASGAFGEHIHIVFGPPGTGKTRTIAAAVREVLQTQEHARILCAAPSDTAADWLALRLLDTPDVMADAGMLRLNWHTRMLEEVPVQLLQHSAVDQATNCFNVPDDIAERRVIVCTCSAAAILARLGLGPGHFSCILIDESVQASEPELLVPLSLAGHGCRVVLAGDPYQLGPNIHSRAARAGGLGISLQERLMKLAPYADVTHVCRALRCPMRPDRVTDRRATAARAQANVLITHLIRSYRSHKDILAMPSSLFYAGRLRPVADRTVTDRLTGWSTVRTPAQCCACCAPRDSALLPTSWQLPNPDFPIFMYGMEGVERHDELSDSFYNNHEASAVVDLVQQLLRDAAGKLGTCAGGHIGLRPFAVRGRGRRGCCVALHCTAPHRGRGVCFPALCARRIGVLIGRTHVHTLDPTKTGIIAPYRAQVVRIRAMLRFRDLGAISVGTVEDCQGQEYQAAILSTVLSKVRVRSDAPNEDFGVVYNAKRFNVAVTRGEALLCIVGNPSVLLHDPNWHAYIAYIVRHGSYAGIRLSDEYLHQAALMSTSAEQLMQCARRMTLGRPLGYSADGASATQPEADDEPAAYFDDEPTISETGNDSAVVEAAA